MKRFFTLFILTFGFIILLSPGASAETRSAVFYNGDAVIKNIALDSEDRILLPEGPAMGTKKFIGWAVTRNGTETLHSAGSTFSDGGGSGDLIFRAVGIELRTLTGAAVSYASPTTLRFDGVLGLEDYNRLVALIGADNITCGMVLAPYMSTNAAPFDLSSALDGLVDRPAAAFSYSTDKFYVFSGRTDEIKDEQLLEKYCGRAYLTVTFDGKTQTLYADYSIEHHVRTAYGVNAAAYEDRSAVSKTTHSQLTQDGCYAPYSQEQLQALCARLDKVVYISTLDNSVQSKYSLDNLSFKEFNNAHYVSPYQVERVLSNEPNGYDTYVITGVNGADFNTVTAYFIGGAYEPPNRTEEWQSDGIYIKHKKGT